MSQPQTYHIPFTKEPIQTLESQDRGAQIKFCTLARSVFWVLSMKPAACHPPDALNFEVPLDFVKICEPLSPKACNLNILNSEITAATLHLNTQDQEDGRINWVFIYNVKASIS